MPPRSITPTAIRHRERQARSLVARYIGLYEHEGWPPEGLHGTDPISAAARRQLACLYTHMKALWEALPESAPLAHRTLLRRTAAAGPLRERHQALRLGCCCGWFRRERRTNRIARGPGRIST